MPSHRLHISYYCCQPLQKSKFWSAGKCWHRYSMTCNIIILFYNTKKKNIQIQWMASQMGDVPKRQPQLLAWCTGQCTSSAVWINQYKVFSYLHSFHCGNICTMTPSQSPLIALCQVLHLFYLLATLYGLPKNGCMFDTEFQHQP